MKELLRMIVVGGSLIGVGLLGVAGCASTVVPGNTRQSDSGITSVVQASLQANDKVKATQVEVVTRESVVYLTGVVDTEEARREAGRVVWSTEGVTGVMNDLTVGERTVGKTEAERIARGVDGVKDVTNELLVGRIKS
jgi:osmotically-inducible protein OsmY